MKNKEKVVVVQDENKEPVAEEIIAQSIKNISDAYNRAMKSGLSERAIVLLISDASGDYKSTVKRILYAMKDLERLYLSRKVESK